MCFRCYINIILTLARQADTCQTCARDVLSSPKSDMDIVFNIHVDSDFLLETFCRSLWAFVDDILYCWEYIVQKTPTVSLQKNLENCMSTYMLRNYHRNQEFICRIYLANQFSKKYHVSSNFKSFCVIGLMYNSVGA